MDMNLYNEKLIEEKGLYICSNKEYSMVRWVYAIYYFNLMNQWQRR